MDRDVPLPGDDENHKHIVIIGKKTYVFDTDEESKDFTFIVFKKHVSPDEAFEHIASLKKKGRYGGKDDEEPDDRPQPPDKRRTSIFGDLPF
jgi:hypothetical protein